VGVRVSAEPGRARWLTALLCLLVLDGILVSPALDLGYGIRALASLAVAGAFALSGGPTWILTWGRVRPSISHVVRVALAVSAGTALLLAFWLLLAPDRELPYTPSLDPGTKLPALLLTAGLLAPVTEELIYRGLVQTCLRELIGSRPAIFLGGFLFWGYHCVAHGVLTPPVHLIAGWLLGWSFERTRSLLAPTLLHALGNLALIGIAWLLAAYPGTFGWLSGPGSG
jgi:membrane protease YdiL (CAAX protease family)